MGVSGKLLVLSSNARRVRVNGRWWRLIKQYGIGRRFCSHSGSIHAGANFSFPILPVASRPASRLGRDLVELLQTLRRVGLFISRLQQEPRK